MTTQMQARFLGVRNKAESVSRGLMRIRHLHLLAREVVDASKSNEEESIELLDTLLDSQHTHVAAIENLIADMIIELGELPAIAQKGGA